MKGTVPSVKLAVADDNAEVEVDMMLVSWRYSADKRKAAVESPVLVQIRECSQVYTFVSQIRNASSGLQQEHSGEDLPYLERVEGKDKGAQAGEDSFGSATTLHRSPLD